MPITVRLDEVLGRRQMSLTELSEAVDITLANLSILKTGKAHTETTGPEAEPRFQEFQPISEPRRFL